MQVLGALSRAPSMMDSESYLAHRIKTLSSIHNRLLKEQGKNKQLYTRINVIKKRPNEDDECTFESNILYD